MEIETTRCEKSTSATYRTLEFFLIELDADVRIGTYG
jgi:hypothetical protein